MFALKIFWGTPDPDCDVRYKGLVHDKTRQEISLMIADSVAVGFKWVQNSASYRLVVQRTATEEHVVVHVFSRTFVAVERTELPPGVQLDSQTIEDDDDRQQNNNYTSNWWHADYPRSFRRFACSFSGGIHRKLLFVNHHNAFAKQSRRAVTEDILSKSVSDGK